MTARNHDRRELPQRMAAPASGGQKFSRFVEKTKDAAPAPCE